MAREKRRFRADHVGSLVRPERLRQARRSWETGRLPADELRETERECIREAVAMQERVGLQSISDGEFPRGTWQEGFHRAVDGFSTARDVPHSFPFRGRPREEPQPTAGWPHAEQKLVRRRPMVADQFAFVKGLTAGVAKTTILSPSQLHSGGGDAVIRPAYSERGSYMQDVAAIYREEIAELGRLGCTYLQLDDVALPVICDPENRERVKARGEDPDRNIDLYIDTINAAVRDRPAGMLVNVHMCRGNRGEGMASGGYEPIAERVFNRLDVDGFLLEYDTPRAGDFMPLRFVPKGKTVALGLVSTKVRELESADSLKARIDEAARHLDIDQLCLCPQCGFASSFSTDRFSIEDQERKLARIVEVASDVWR